MTTPLRIARILVPVDGSDYSRFAAEHALRIAQAYGAAVIFVHAIDEQVVEQLTQAEADDGQRVRERLREHGRLYLRDMARLADEHQVTHQEEIDQGDPCGVICETATRTGADLIVMGKIGRRGARRILVGSVTRRVTEATDRPVLIVSGPPVAA
jgi:nucleotide-binding universal stress UspA family protein